MDLLGVEHYYVVTIHYFISPPSQITSAVTDFIRKVPRAQRGCRWPRGTQPACEQNREPRLRRWVRERISESSPSRVAGLS